MHLKKFGNLIRLRTSGGIDGEQVPVLACKRAVQQFGRVTRNTALKQCAFRTRIHDGGAEFPKILDGMADDVDALFVRFGEKLLRHVLADDADAETSKAPRIGEGGIRLSRLAADAEYGHLVFRIVAGDDIEYFGR